MPFTRLFPVALATAGLLLTACGDAPSDRQAPADAPGAEAPAGARSAESPTGSDAGITSAVELEDRGDQVSIRVTLDGVRPGERYPVNVHAGGCDVRGGIRLPMGRVTGGDNGVGSVRMTVARDRLPARPFAVRTLSPDDAPVACSQIDPEPRDTP